eukprot:scaffold8236_cov123-Isochrysis_galbana.AAC.3
MLNRWLALQCSGLRRGPEHRLTRLDRGSRLLSGGAVNFRLDKSGQQTTINKFTRTVQFVQVNGVWEDKITESGKCMIDEEW